jgi:hypothetical protein
MRPFRILHELRRMLGSELRLLQAVPQRRLEASFVFAVCELPGNVVNGVALDIGRRCRQIGEGPASTASDDLLQAREIDLLYQRRQEPIENIVAATCRPVAEGGDELIALFLGKGISLMPKGIFDE